MKPKKAPDFTQALLYPLVLALLMWLVYKLDVIYRLNLYEYGVFPRTTHGLLGILTTPLIHDTSGYSHVFENTIALLFFGTFLYYFYNHIASRIIFLSWIITQTMVWVLAKPVYHVGMSGVIYSLAFFLITGSIIRKNKQLSGVLFLIIFLYGSIFWGLFPLLPGISWESHLMGALTGILLGILYRKVDPVNVIKQSPIQDDPADDDPDAWWKTGVIPEKRPEETIGAEPTIHYHYIPEKEKKNDVN